MPIRLSDKTSFVRLFWQEKHEEGHADLKPGELMALDKQLGGVSLEEVVGKRRLGQALNTKEFAVLAGISYSAAREWFHSPGFPAFRGLVFWQDFTDWRRTQVRLSDGVVESTSPVVGREGRISMNDLPARAARLLQQD
jgi:hypothetical protein